MIASGHRYRYVLRLPLWGLVISAISLFLAFQPLTVAVVGLAIVALVVLVFITPLAALLLLLILAPLRTLVATEAPGQLPLDVGQIILLVFLCAYAISRAVRRQPVFTRGWTPLFVPLGVFIIFTGISAFSASSLGAWLNEWLKWAQITGLVALVLCLAIARRWEWLVFGLIVAGVANAVVGLYEFFGGSGALHLVINDRFFRAFGTFGQPNPFGGFMGLLSPVAFMVALGYSLRVWRHWRSHRVVDRTSIFLSLFYAVASFVLVIGIVVSWSRGSWLGFVLSLAVMLLAWPRRVWSGVLLFIGIGALAAGLWFAGLLPQSVIDRINSATDEYFTFTDVRGVKITNENYPVVERLAHWQAALRMASSNPWLGVGFGNYEVAYPDYQLINWHFPLGHAHNYYLNVLAEIGIIGLLGYGKVWFGIMYLTWRTRYHPNELARSTAVGLLGSWVYLLAHSLFDNLYVNNIFLHLGLMLGVLAVLYNHTWKHYKVGI